MRRSRASTRASRGGEGELECFHLTALSCTCLQGGLVFLSTVILATSPQEFANQISQHRNTWPLSCIIKMAQYRRCGIYVRKLTCPSSNARHNSCGHLCQWHGAAGRGIIYKASGTSMAWIFVPSPEHWIQATFSVTGPASS